MKNPITTRPTRRSLAPCGRLVLFFVLAVLAVPSAALAQRNPVFVDDAPGASEALASALGHARAGNLDTAVRVLQGLLDDNADRLTASDDDPLLMIPVRARVNGALLADAALLARYRELESTEAQRLLDGGAVEAAERSRLLTPAGYEAALRLAQIDLERARFAAASRRLAALEEHPDRRREGADAARLARRLARYWPGAAPMAERWARRWLPREDAPRPVRGPEPRTERSSFDPAGPLDFSGLVPRPIRSSPLVDPSNETGGLLGVSPVVQRGRNSLRLRVEPARTVFPALAGDTLVVSDGVSITAMDRYTLERRWSVTGRTTLDPRRGGVRSNTDSGPMTVGVWGRVVVAATAARQAAGRMLGDGRVRAVDLDTGTERWSVGVDLLAGELAGAVPTGAVAARDGVAVVPVLQSVRERRLVNSVLVALDVRDGTLVWKRLVASAGALPQSVALDAGTVPVVEDGVVYYAEALGTISAIDIVTGRYLWARRSPDTEPALVPARALWPTRPVVDAGVLYTVEPVTNRAVALDAATGRVLGARPAGEMGEPGYLLVAGGQVVGVGQSELRAVAVSSFRDPGVTPRAVYTLGSGRFAGRAAVVGEDVLIPVGDGFAVVDPEEAGQEPVMLGFGNTGNFVVAPAQLAVLGATGMNSYLVWEQAREALEARSAEHPADAAPAVTLAELAYRAGRQDTIVPAIDTALASLRLDPRSGRSEQSRRRLFRAIDAMVDPAAVMADREALDDGVLGALIARMREAASSPSERALYALRDGSFAESAGRPGEAVASYQRVLDDPALSESRVELGPHVRLARAVCTARLRRLVRSQGGGVYAVFDREAHAALDRLGAGSAPEEYVALARRYPVASASLRAWLSASEAFTQRGRRRGAIAALEEGLSASDGVPGAPEEVVAEITGRLVTRLVEGGRAAAASATIARVMQQRPGLVLRDHGAVVDLVELTERIAAARTRVPRRARLGRLVEDAPMTPIAGLLAIRPLYRALDDDLSLALFAGEDVLEAWEVNPAGGMTRRWSAPLDPALSLLRLDSAGALVSLGFDRQRRLGRIDARSGAVVWETEAFDAGFRGGSAPGPGETVALPAGRVRPRSEILVALRDDSAALIERSGRAAGYDVAEGRTLWAERLPIDQVYDAAESGGLLIVVGVRRGGEPAQRVLAQPVGLIVNMSTGRVVSEVDLGAARARWVRASGDGVVVIGTDRGIMGFDLIGGAQRWLIGDVAARGTLEAWPFPGRLIVLDAGNNLWQIEIENGEMSRAPLDTRERLQGDATSAEGIAADDVAVMSLPRGLVMYDRRGRLTGLDERETVSNTGPIGFGERVAVVLEPRGFEPRLYEARVIELSTGRLLQSKLYELPARPHTVDVIDGRVLVGAGNGTIVLDATGAEPDR